MLCRPTALCKIRLSEIYDQVGKRLLEDEYIIVYFIYMSILFVCIQDSIIYCTVHVMIVLKKQETCDACYMLL